MKLLSFTHARFVISAKCSLVVFTLSFVLQCLAKNVTVKAFSSGIFYAAWVEGINYIASLLGIFPAYRPAACSNYLTMNRS